MEVEVEGGGRDVPAATCPRLGTAWSQIRQTPAGRRSPGFVWGWPKPNVDPTAFPSDSFTVGAVRAVGPPVKQTPRPAPSSSRPPTPLIFTILLNSGVGCWTLEDFSNGSQAEV